MEGVTIKGTWGKLNPMFLIGINDFEIDLDDLYIFQTILFHQINNGFEYIPISDRFLRHETYFTKVPYKRAKSSLERMVSSGVLQKESKSHNGQVTAHYRINFHLLKTEEGLQNILNKGSAQFKEWKDFFKECSTNTSNSKKYTDGLSDKGKSLNNEIGHIIRALNEQCESQCKTHNDKAEKAGGTWKERLPMRIPSNTIVKNCISHFLELGYEQIDFEKALWVFYAEILSNKSGVKKNATNYFFSPSNEYATFLAYHSQFVTDWDVTHHE